MGCCYSCFKDENSSQNGEPNEQSRLLANPVSNNTTIQGVGSDDFVPSYPNSLPKKTDEQSALNRILQETATNVIDVAAMSTHNLEHHEYIDRMKHYALKLQRVGAGGAAGAGARPPCLLLDIPTPDKHLSNVPIQDSDVQQIMSFCNSATAALAQLKVEHKEDLVVPFRIP